MKRALSILAAACILAPGAALAHTGAGGTDGIVHGLMHPVTGLDHVLAMVAVGVLAAFLGGRALWLVPASFVALAAVGGALGARGVPVPFVELGISASIILLGLAIALQARLLGGPSAESGVLCVELRQRPPAAYAMPPAAARAAARSCGRARSADRHVRVGPPS